ncbi:nucleotidyltransferase family protein [Bacillus sp. SS-TM]
MLTFLSVAHDKDATSKGEITIKAGGIVVEYNPFHNGHLHYSVKKKH